MSVVFVLTNVNLTVIEFNSEQQSNGNLTIIKILVRPPTGVKINLISEKIQNVTLLNEKISEKNLTDWEIVGVDVKETEDENGPSNGKEISRIWIGSLVAGGCVILLGLLVLCYKAMCKQASIAKDEVIIVRSLTPGEDNIVAVEDD